MEIIAVLLTIIIAVPVEEVASKDRRDTTFVRNRSSIRKVLADPNEPIRLNKFLSNAGVCSRREADEFIQKGAVKVNDVVVTELGTKITRQDVVTFNEKPVQIESKVYIVLNKPKNCVTTSDDPQERLTVMDLVKNALPRTYLSGRPFGPEIRQGVFVVDERW